MATITIQVSENELLDVLSDIDWAMALQLARDEFRPLIRATRELRYELTERIGHPCRDGWLDEIVTMRDGELKVSQGAFVRLGEALDQWLDTAVVPTAFREEGV